MSHAIDIDGVHEKLFVLRNLVFASRSYASEENIASDIDYGYGFFDDYWGYLKVILSNYIIEVSVKMRMIQEHCGNDEDLTEFEIDALNGMSIGAIKEGKFDLTLRESFNKVIHSKRATIEFIDDESGKFKYWDGNFNLYGFRGKEEWHLELSVGCWAKSVASYLTALEDNEKTINLGQDWS